MNMDPILSKYAAFFGRGPDFVREPQAGVSPAVSVARFPPVAAGFFRRFVTPVHDRCVYITHGMSEARMCVPAEDAAVYPSRIELVAYCTGAYVGANDGQDMVTALLQGLAAVPFQTGGSFGPMQTAAFAQPICPGTEMSAFFFAVPHGVEMSRLCSCTPRAELVVSVMPITAAERAFAVEHGAERLVGLFEKHGVLQVDVAVEVVFQFGETREEGAVRVAGLRRGCEAVGQLTHAGQRLTRVVVLPQHAGQLAPRVVRPRLGAKLLRLRQ
jgi:hypothetical protein